MGWLIRSIPPESDPSTRFEMRKWRDLARAFDVIEHNSLLNALPSFISVLPLSEVRSIARVKVSLPDVDAFERPFISSIVNRRDPAVYVSSLYIFHEYSSGCALESHAIIIYNRDEVIKSILARGEEGVLKWAESCREGLLQGHDNVLCLVITIGQLHCCW